MSYPMREVRSPFGGVDYREMTPTEYEDMILWFRNYIVRHEGDDVRRDVEYNDYLKRWFGNGQCDGWPDFETRYKMHQLPMSFNVYFYG